MAEALYRHEDAVLREAEALRDEAIAFLQDLIRIPTVNPPGDCYEPCAEFLEEKLSSFGYETRLIVAEHRPEHSRRYPRTNVIGSLAGAEVKPVLHFNGHIDVVPPGHGWTIEPFGGSIRDGRIYGRGATDQKAGIVASVLAVEAIRRAGLRIRGKIEQSGTVDEESGGFAGVAYLAEQRIIHRNKTTYVIMTEPLNVNRVCLGHRGVYWFRITTHGRTAHGSMPFLGVSAIDLMNEVIHAIHHELRPQLAGRLTAMPVEPHEARRATLNINSISGGQADASFQTPCVADRCSAVFDRRFLLEESFESVRNEVVELLKRAQSRNRALASDLEDLMVVQPVLTEADSKVAVEVAAAVRCILGRPAELIASPGTYDQKHVSRIGMVKDCIAYGPGQLHLAHQPDEYCEIEDLITAVKVLALATMRLAGTC